MMSALVRDMDSVVGMHKAMVCKAMVKTMTTAGVMDSGYIICSLN
jgi:hypothetical protein